MYVDMSRGDNVQVILGAIGPFWAKLGLGVDEFRGVRVFCVVKAQKKKAAEEKAVQHTKEDEEKVQKESEAKQKNDKLEAQDK